MHSLILLALAPLALANDLSKRSVVLPRQGSDAFKPIPIPQENCQYPCGETWCLIPSRGDTCCAEGYSCAGGSFCLTQGYCCPDGDDPATCASQFGLSLPSNFKPGQTVAISGPSSTPAAAAPPATSSAVVAQPPTTTPTPSSTPAAAPVTPTSTPSSSSAPPFPTPVTNATLPPPATGTGASTPGGTGVAQFTGGAMRVAIDGVVGAMVFGGAVGLLV